MMIGGMIAMDTGCHFEWWRLKDDAVKRGGLKEQFGAGKI